MPAGKFCLETGCGLFQALEGGERTVRGDLADFSIGWIAELSKKSAYYSWRLTPANFLSHWYLDRYGRETQYRNLNSF